MIFKAKSVDGKAIRAMRERERKLFAAFDIVREFGTTHGEDAMRELFARNGHDMIRTADAIRVLVGLEFQSCIQNSTVEG